MMVVQRVKGGCPHGLGICEHPQHCSEKSSRTAGGSLDLGQAGDGGVQQIAQQGLCLKGVGTAAMVLEHQEYQDCTRGQGGERTDQEGTRSALSVQPAPWGEAAAQDTYVLRP